MIFALQEEVEISRQKYEESLLMTNGTGDDVGSEVSGSSSCSNSDQMETKTEEIPEIVVDPVDEGREVRIAEICHSLNIQFLFQLSQFFSNFTVVF